MDRMAQHTKQPEVLRELFEALGNDPFVIAECLARPVLSERLVTNLYRLRPEISVAEPMQRAEAQQQVPNRNGSSDRKLHASCNSESVGRLHRRHVDSNQHHQRARWPIRTHRGLDWQRNDRLGRSDAAAAMSLNTGGRYNPSTDSWTATSTTNAPDCPRLFTRQCGPAAK